MAIYVPFMKIYVPFNIYTQTAVSAIFDGILRHGLTEPSLNRNGGSVALQNSLRCASKQPPLDFNAACFEQQRCLRRVLKQAALNLKTACL